MNNLSVPYLFLFLHNELRKLTTLQLKHTVTAPPRSYPASSWFFLRQTREKPLRATVCFPIENAQVRHAPRDTFDVNFICQFIFHLKRLYKRKQIFRQKRSQKNDLYLRRSIRPFYSCVLSYLAMNASEAGGDLALMQTYLLLSCKCQLVSIRTT